VARVQVQYTDAPALGSWRHEDVLNRSLDHLFVDHLTPGGAYQFCVQALVDDKVGCAASGPSVDRRVRRRS